MAKPTLRTNHILPFSVFIFLNIHTYIDTYIHTYIQWSDPPTNSGIMDFNCNFPAKIAQQPRDQNHKQFERPNLLNPNFSGVEPKYEITLGAAYLEPDQIYSVGACRDVVG